MNKSFLILAFAVASLGLSAQTIPVNPKYGSVSEYECSFRNYEPDPYASAVILWERCDRILDYSLMYAEGYTVTYYRQRIKILKESGRHYGSDRITVRTGADELLKNLEVTTYNYEDGKVVAYPAAKSDITRTRIDDDTQVMSYRAPAVKAGSVIEISYVLRTPLYDLVPPFNFRRAIPVNLCTYTLAYPQGLPKRLKLLDYETDAVTITSGMDPNSGLLVDSFKAVDLPSFKDEPMVYCPDEYLACVSCELGELSWTEVAREFIGSEVVQQLKARTPFRKEIKEMADSQGDRHELLSSVIALVKKTVRWNGQIAFYPKSFSSIGNEVYGTSADINAVVGAALGEAGFTVTPVLLSLRQDGTVMESFPSYGGFSTFILHITGPDEIDIYYDAADPTGYFNILPENYLVSNAMEILPGGGFRWVDLRHLVNSITTYSVIAGILPDGNVSGTVSGLFFNNSCCNMKNILFGVTPETLGGRMKEIFDIDDVSSADVDGIYEPSSCVNMKVGFLKKSTMTDSLILVKPFLTRILSEKVIRNRTRRLPLEFPYPEGISYVMKLGVPEGYEVAELPDPIALSSGLGQECMMSAVSDGKTVTMYFKFNNSTYFVMPENYPVLKDFWGSVCSALESRIAFRKID